jgi:hypothetical protein
VVLAQELAENAERPLEAGPRPVAEVGEATHLTPRCSLPSRRERSRVGSLPDDKRPAGSCGHSSRAAQHWQRD